MGGDGSPVTPLPHHRARGSASGTRKFKAPKKPASEPSKRPGAAAAPNKRGRKKALARRLRAKDRDTETFSHAGRS